VQEASKLKGLLAFLIKSIYKLSFEEVVSGKKPELQISFEVLLTKTHRISLTPLKYIVHVTSVLLSFPLA
jgi:hypothetical protein